MPLPYEFQHSFKYFTNIPEDVITNTFHMLWNGVGDPLVTDFDAAKGDLKKFYERIFTNATTAGLAPWVLQTGVRVKAYDLSAPKPRVPAYDSTYTSAAVVATSSPLPPETALCLSYRSVPINGIPLASQRGRLYIGGIGTGITSGNSTTFPVPGSTLISNLTTSAAPSLVLDLAGHNWIWIVYSRKLGLPFTITDGWVDNAFDTQRRRGQKATARTTWT